MSNQLTTTEMLSIADSFAQSGMFPDIKSASQAAVKIQAGKEFGIQPFAAMTGIHIIQGKPVIGAGLMASRVKASGRYDYRVTAHDEKVCSIEYFAVNGAKKESIGVSTFTIEDARKAGTKNLDKFPKNMLFARAMSNGVKWYTPDIYDVPVYVPEEMPTAEPTDATPISVETTAPNAETQTPTIKQPITDAVMKKTLKRIEAGEDIVVKCADHYDLTLEQLATLNEARQAFLKSQK